MERESKSAKIIRTHYGLTRPVTFAEVEAEISNLRRLGPGNLDDSQHLLAAKLNVFECSNDKR